MCIDFYNHKNKWEKLTINYTFCIIWAWFLNSVSNNSPHKHIAVNTDHVYPWLQTVVWFIFPFIFPLLFRVCMTIYALYIVSIQHCFSLLFVTASFWVTAWKLIQKSFCFQSQKRCPWVTQPCEIPSAYPECKLEELVVRQDRKGVIYSFSGTKHAQFHEEGCS